MEYESNILKRLIDTYGVVGNPRYISEIIKEFIVRGKERFPELFTYQADWLAHIDEFGLNPSYTVSYTGQSIYAPNTLERPVKSAILTGNTLVNLCKTSGKDLVYTGTNSVTNLNHPIEANKWYYMIINVKQNTFEKPFRFSGWSFANGCKVMEGSQIGTNDINLFNAGETGVKGFKLGYSEIVDGLGKTLIMFVQSSSETLTRKIVYDIMFLEYKEGMENWDIPYFTGMQSVKMPVLTTTNEDGTKTNILSCNEEVELRGIGEVQDTLDCLTGEVVERVGEIVLDGSDDENWYTGELDGNSVPFFQAIIKGRKANDKLICDKLTVRKDIEGDKIAVSTTVFGIMGTSSNIIRIKNGATSLKEFKQWLSQNPITVQYELATESIKTVDLTILDQNGQNVKQLMSFNGGTHFNTGSLEGSLLPSVSVSVETDLEETLKVCSIEGNTM